MTKQIDKDKLLELFDSQIRYYDGCTDRNSSDVCLMLESIKAVVERGRLDIEPSVNIIITDEQRKLYRTAFIGGYLRDWEFDQILSSEQAWKEKAESRKK